MNYENYDYDPSMYDSMNASQYATDPAASSAMTGAALAFFLIFTLIAVVVSYVLYAIFLSRIFKKAGVEGWKAWVPVYNSWIMYELGDQKGYWAILMLIPVVNIVAAVFMFIAMYKIGLKLGKDGAFVLLAIFLPLVWLIWLAVDKSTWKGTKPAVAAATPTPVQPASTTPPAETQAPEDDEPTPPKAV